MFHNHELILAFIHWLGPQFFCVVIRTHGRNLDWKACQRPIPETHPAGSEARTFDLQIATPGFLPTELSWPLYWCRQNIILSFLNVDIHTELYWPPKLQVKWLTYPHDHCLNSYRRIKFSRPLTKVFMFDLQPTLLSIASWHFWMPNLNSCCSGLSLLPLW